MDTDHKWSHQFSGMEKINAGLNPNTNLNPRPSMEKRSAPHPNKEQPLGCPRCNSTNTKFCYYNNYSLSQPRYFCKNCRRYWTEGGSIRNVPVGGGSRKNKRSITLTTETSPPPQPQMQIQIPSSSHHQNVPTYLRVLDLDPPPQGLSLLPPSNIHGNDLSLNTFNHIGLGSQFGHHTVGSAPFMEKGGFSGGFEGFGGEEETGNGRLMFPFLMGNGSGVEQNNKEGGSSSGWWTGSNGMLGGSW